MKLSTTINHICLCLNCKGSFFLPTEKYTNDCPPTFVYDYKMTSCGRTCRSLSQSDLTCGVDFTELDGCGCAEGTYLNEKNECVLPSQCSCYAGDTVVHPGQVTTLSNGQTWYVFPYILYFY